MMDDRSRALAYQPDDYELIARAIKYLVARADQQPRLAEVAAAVGLSEYHFQRLFSRWAGISPKRFLQFLTKENARRLLDASQSLLQTSFSVGLSSLGRLHDLFVSTEAVTPGEYSSRGAGLTIRYGIHETPFGKCLIAVSARGICHLSFVETSEGAAVDSLAADWARADLSEDAESTRPLVRPIFRLSAEAPTTLKVHLRGTNFQLKVWEALLRIPPGALTTYGRLASLIGQPTASRAVGSAVGRNPIAVLIPCHRVIRESGEVGQYRYGAERKRALLLWESGRAGAAAHQGADLAGAYS